MYSVAVLGPRFFKGFSCLYVVSRSLCSRSINGDDVENGFGSIEDFLNEPWKNSFVENNVEEKTSALDGSLGSWGSTGESEWRKPGKFSERRSFVDEVKNDAAMILEILSKDCPGFDAKAVLSSLDVRVSGPLAREVLFGILKEINHVNKNRCAKLGYKFFVWSGEQESYSHTIDVYHMMMKIFAETEEFKAMWSLVDEMTEKGYPTTARTFNILICTCGGAGLARKVIERFIKSKHFNFRPFKHSFNAILHSLLTINHYRLIEWVYQQMLVEGHPPDVLTYNIVMCAKFRLGKLDQFHHLLDEMNRRGFAPDLHTFNLLLHVYGKLNKPAEAQDLLDHMKKVGVDPSVLHFTSLIDGLSRVGNLNACQYFFDEMINHGCMPDVVCYTVLITGYIAAEKFDAAQHIFDEMIDNGHLPNVFTYNSMIRGLCASGKFEEACSMLKEMESKGCNPNFLVYTTLVGSLRKEGKLSEAHEVIRHMVEKGQYAHLLPKIKRYRKR